MEYMKFTFGLITGGALVGALAGLIPLITGIKHGKASMGWKKLAICAAIDAVACLILINGLGLYGRGGAIAFVSALAYALASLKDVK